MWSFFRSFVVPWCLASASALEEEGEEAYVPRTTWRAAETAEGISLGAEIRGINPEFVAGARGISFTPSGAPFHVELVHDKNLEDFLRRRTPASVHLGRPSVPRTDAPLEEQRRFCSESRFLLNDPRVGLFNNQRLSYETAIQVAIALGRTLVMPGFFKFPHPMPYDGLQWVPVRGLFNWSALQNCNPFVIELEDLLRVCGHDVLDNHVTVPFETMWMRSSTKAPWINGTRPDLQWQSMDGEQYVRLRSKESKPLVPLRFTDYQWRVLKPFLADGIAEAQTIRTHGLLAYNGTLDAPVCFFPADEVVGQASRLLGALTHDGHHEDDHESSRPRQLLALHLRIFKHSVDTSGGYLQAELVDKQESLCNFDPHVYRVLVLSVLQNNFGDFWPTHTYMATNEADIGQFIQYVSGIPGLRKNPYTPAQHDSAVTASASLDALRSILVDVLICAWADYFIGNACSTLSHYMFSLRRSLGLPFNSTMLLGGEFQHGTERVVQNFLQEVGW